MSTSYGVGIGFQVSRGDFWREETWTDDFETCPLGHKPPVDKTDPFCSKCGGRFDKRQHSKAAPTLGFKEFCGRQDPLSFLNPQSYLDIAPEIFEGFSIFTGNAPFAYGKGGPVYVLGYLFHLVSDRNPPLAGTLTIPVSEVLHFSDRCQKLANRLKIGTPVQLWMVDDFY